MSQRKELTFMEHIQELLNRRDEVSREVYALEDSLYKAEQRFLRTNLQSECIAFGFSTICSVQKDSDRRIPSPDEFIFSNSSATLKKALNLRSRTQELRRRREERAQRLSAEASNAGDPDSSDTDPEMGGIAAFEAAAKRDAELRERFRKEYESSHSEKSDNSP